MTKGEGFIALLYALKGMVEASAMAILTGAGVIIFFWIIVRFILQKSGKQIGNKIEPNQIMLAVFLLFVIFALYSLIALTGSIFGVNSSPSGGLYVQ